MLGAAIGLAIPLAFHVFRVLTRVHELGHLRPVVFNLFWPSTYITAFNYPRTAFLLGLTVLGNALLFGAVAAIFRRSFIFVLVALSILAWSLMPPSDATLQKRFNQRRAELQQLVEMSKQDTRVVRITNSELETGNGQSFGIGELDMAQSERWNEYKNKLSMLRMSEAIFAQRSGEVYIAAHTLGGRTTSSYYGYLYCPSIAAQPPFYVPCIEKRDSVDRESYHYKKVGSDWYIYKVFRQYDLE